MAIEITWGFAPEEHNAQVGGLTKITVLATILDESDMECDQSHQAFYTQNICPQTSTAHIERLTVVVLDETRHVTSQVKRKAKLNKLRAQLPLKRIYDLVICLVSQARPLRN